MGVNYSGIAIREVRPATCRISRTEMPGINNLRIYEIPDRRSPSLRGCLHCRTDNMYRWPLPNWSECAREGKRKGEGRTEERDLSFFFSISWASYLSLALNVEKNYHTLSEFRHCWFLRESLQIYLISRISWMLWHFQGMDSLDSRVSLLLTQLKIEKRGSYLPHFEFTKKKGGNTTGSSRRGVIRSSSIQ